MSLSASFHRSLVCTDVIMLQTKLNDFLRPIHPLFLLGSAWRLASGKTNAQTVLKTTMTDGKTSSIPELQDMPGPTSFPGIGAMWQYLPGGRFHGLDLNDAIRRLNILYGDVVREEIVPGLTVVRLFNPNDFAQVYKAEGDAPRRVLFGLLAHYNKVHNYGVQGLLTSQGDEWKHLRRQVQQLILPPKAVLGYAPLHVSIAKDFVERISLKHKEHEDFLPEVYKYVTEAIAAVIFDQRLGLLEEGGSVGKHFIRAVQESLALSQKELEILPLFKYLPTAVFARFVETQNIIRSVTENYMHSAMARGEGLQGRLIQSLLFTSKLTYRETFTFLSEFFAAAVDTTGHGLAFSLYALAKHPDVQEKLYNEVKNMADDDIVSGCLQSAQYLRAFLKETLRVYPVAPGLGRTLQTDSIIAGYRIPAGTNVVLQYDMAGKDNRFLSSPELFSPERWLREANEETCPFLTLPFGFGPRSCIGRRLAMQEIEIVLAKILHKFRIAYKGDNMPIIMKMINKPACPLNFTFVKRTTQNRLPTNS